MKQRRSWVGSASMYAAVFAAGVGHGATARGADGTPRADAGVLEAIVVTAERREQKLLETPATVAVVDPELLEKSVRRINDLAGVAPGVTVATRTYTPAIFIRGVGSTRPIGNQSVGIYLDDVYIARPFGAGLYGSLPDTQRIEVLSGPQGTLYGKNTGGGALKLVTLQPPDENSAWLSVAAGDKTNEARAYASGVLVPEVLNGSLAFAHNRIYDDTENVTLGKDVNGLSSQQARGILKWTPSDSLKAIVSLDGMRSETDYVLSSVIRPDGGVRRTFSDIDPTQDYDGWGISATVEKQFAGSLRLKSITAFRDASMIMPTDSDGEPGYLSGFVQDLDMRQHSQELQLFGDFERLSFIGGLIYFREGFDHYRWSWTNNSFSIIDSSVTSTTVGVYGQVDYRLTDKLTATAGLRYSRETSELDSQGYGSNLAGEELALRYSVNGLEKDWTAVQPKVSLSYQWTPGLLSYATYSQGSTAGGYNSAAATLAVAQTPVDPDEINAYEVGIKTFGWGGRLSTSTAAFYNDFKDYQATISNPIIDGQLVPGAVFANAGRAHTFGLEFASTAKLSRALQASLSVAYLKTEFDEYLNPTGSPNSNFVDYDLPNSPEWSGSVRLNYDVPLSSGAHWSANGVFRYEDESYSSVSADRELTKQPAQTYVDAGIYFTTASGRWSFSFAGTNLLNKDYGLPGSYTPSLGFQTVLWNRERQLTLGVRRDFF